MPSERKWTEWRLAKLRELAPTTSASGIASVLGGISRNAVISAMHRYGIAAANKMGHHNSRTARNVEKKRERKRAAKLLKQEPAMSSKKLTEDELYKPLPDARPATVRAVPFMELENHHCREVVGHDGNLALYCGARRFHKSTSYCRHHAARNQPALFLKYVQAAE